jgi:hypothetical protein
MAAVVVFIREKTRDQAEMDAYTPKAGASLAGHPITIRAAYGRQEVLEGPEVEGVVIVSFPGECRSCRVHDPAGPTQGRDCTRGLRPPSGTDPDSS